MTITVQVLNSKGAVIDAFDTIKPWKAQAKRISQFIEALCEEETE
jgi:hypothetical protein